MTAQELDRLQRDVEEVARRRAAVGRVEVAAFGETVVLFRRLASVARREIAQGSEVEPRLSSGVRTLAAILVEGAPDGAAGRPRGGSPGGHVEP